MTKAATMYQVVESWQCSGMGQQKYAATIGMAYSTLQYWIKKYKEHHTRTTLEPMAGFVPITLTDPAVEVEPPTVVEQPYSVVITLASGTRIELR